jgi:hypothetical protein
MNNIDSSELVNLKKMNVIKREFREDLKRWNLLEMTKKSYAIKTAKYDFRQSSELGYIEYILDRLFEFERE